jgi:putative OPT family oligopeptide transporter
VDFQFIPAMREIAEKARLVLRVDAIAFILGLGYVMGLRASTLLCAGGVLANFVLVPIIWMVGHHLSGPVYPAPMPISEMSAAMIFRWYVRYVGVGAIATAGIFGILKSLKIMVGSFSIAAKAFRHGEAEGQERTDRDMPIIQILIGVVVSSLAIAIFLGNVGATSVVLLIGLILTLVFSFFFTSVAANAIATTSRNPVSGMTMLTIIISSVVLLEFGVSGRSGMFFVMAIAGMVCTALSVSGQTITDLKTGYWLGNTPVVQERVKFLGVICSSVVVGLVIVALAQTFQFGETAPGDTRPVLASPQASIMKALVEGFMSRQPVPWLLFGAGAAVAVIMEMLAVPALIVALGMYLPLELNSGALVGGIISHYVARRSEHVGGAAGRSMRERAIIIASGLMAGGALGGVFGAALRLFGWYREDLVKLPFYGNDPVSQLVSAFGFLALCAYLWFGAMKKERVS